MEKTNIILKKKEKAEIGKGISVIDRSTLDKYCKIE